MNAIPNRRNRQILKAIQVASWILTLFFISALGWAVYQAVITGNQLPIWAWAGVLTLFAAAAGLIVAFAVYRGVAAQVGPFDFEAAGRASGVLMRESKRVDPAGAQILSAEIKMLEGILKLEGGSMAALQADFEYDQADWQAPVVDYAVDADQQLGRLKLEQRSTGRPAMRQGRCEWQLKLNRDLPTEIEIVFGAGEAELDLKDLNLTHLRVKGGVGKMSLDLSGSLSHSLEASIETGIGDTLIHLPSSIGVRVESYVGFGNIQARGLKQDGPIYTNSLYGQTKENLDLIIEGGIGKIKLESNE